MNLTQSLYINGQWRAPLEGDTFVSIDPSNKEVIATLGAASSSDVDLAVSAARAAFDNGSWSGLTGAERAAFLRKIADKIETNKEALAKIEVKDNGKPYPEALWDIEDTAGCFAFYAELAEQLDNEREANVTLSDERFSSVARKEPIGVAGAIIPWNFPMLMAAWKVAPALAAGCTIVLKPSEVTSLTAIELAKIIDECGLPKGAFNLITGLGPGAGAPLSSHPDIDKLAFTGSVPTGSRIMAEAAKDIKNVSLELGGKSPFVIFDDADLDKAVEWILFGIFWNKGEVCSATSRVLVQEGLYPALLERLIEVVKGIKMGNGLEDDVLLGPVVNEAQYEKVLSAIRNGLSEGATLAYGGKTPDGFGHGYYIEPTIFTDVPTDASIWKDEIFGPVVCIATFKTEEEAIQLANDSEYGLAAAVMSKDNERCQRVARAFRAGIVWINCSQPTFTEAPWGGYKKSGIGRELGVWGFNNYLETKQITSFNSDEPWGWYIK
jgi:betaine-aldehyde dehydrogenase